jgi:hypothetical protein
LRGAGWGEQAGPHYTHTTMAQVITAKSPDVPQPYTVLRAICMQGERVEPGATVQLTRLQYTELAAAAKVGPYVPPAKAKKPAPAAAAEAPPSEVAP